MRNLLILVIFIPFVLCGQEKYFKPTSTWKIDKMINIVSWRNRRSNGDETYKLFIKNDTVINSTKYYKLYKTGILYLDNPFEYSNQYVGAIRDSNARVLFIEKNKRSEVVLYDYNLKIGDTIKSKIANGKIVNDIDTLDDGRRKFYISKAMIHGMDALIIEGIGSSGGLFSEPSVGHYMYNDSYLICYSENNKIIYKGDDRLNCGCDELTNHFPVNPKGVWYINMISSCFTDVPGEGEDIFRYFIDRDTVINDTVYYQIYKSGVAYYEEPFYYEHTYCGALRNANNKFFYVEKGKSVSKMLYDFDRTVGDTLGYYLKFPILVKKVDTLPGGRRIIKYGTNVMSSCTPENELIEGIGHRGGIMEDAPCTHPCFMGYYLTCYKENDYLIYSNNYGMFKFGCEKTHSLPDLSNEIVISPIPTRDFLNIHFKTSIAEYTSIAVYNSEGKLLMKEYFKKVEKISLNISSLSKGIYLLNITTDKINVNRKFIKD